VTNTYKPGNLIFSILRSAQIKASEYPEWLEVSQLGLTRECGSPGSLAVFDAGMMPTVLLT
jgi:hypothetical protein